MKLVLFVEGHTEKKALPEFFKRWLDPRLAQPIGIKVVRFEGWRDYVDDIARKVELNLSGKSGVDVIGAIGSLEQNETAPAEYDPLAWQAIRRGTRPQATNTKYGRRVIIEPAGNAGVNLGDTGWFQDKFTAVYNDSGAVVVGNSTINDYLGIKRDPARIMGSEWMSTAARAINRTR